jgi:branched-chain amino acid transport system substrate-binding protein
MKSRTLVGLGVLFSVFFLFSAAHSQSKTLKIGVLAPLSGTYAGIGSHETWAIKLAVDELNEKGGILKRKIEIIAEDDEANPTLAVRKATKLITQDKVDFLVGTVHSGATLSIMSIAEKYKIIHMVPVAEATAITEEKCSRYTFRASGNARQQANALGPWMVNNLGKKYYFIGADYAMGWAGVNSMEEIITKNGATSLGKVFAPLGTTDFASYLGKIKAAAPEVLFMTIAGNDAVRLVTQLDEFGFKKTMKITGSPQMIETNILPAMGKASEGLISVSRYVYTIDRPQNKRFVEKFLKYSKGENPNQYSNGSYEAIALLSMGAEKAGSTDSEKMIKALEGLTYDGPQGLTTLRPGDHQSVRDKYIVEIKGGTYNIIGKRAGNDVIGPNLCNKW